MFAIFKGFDLDHIESDARAVTKDSVKQHADFHIGIAPMLVRSIGIAGK